MRRWERAWLIECRVEGLNIERLIRCAGEKEIALVRMKRTAPRAVSAMVRERDVPALQAAADQGGWKLALGRRRGAGRLADWLFVHWLWTAAAMFAAAVLLCATQMMWRVEIVGAGKYEADIRQTLQEWGIVPPQVKGRIDAGALRDALEWRYPDIAWIECGWRGTTLVVRPAEGALPPREVAAEVQDVVAARDAIVYRVVTAAGTALVQPGDFVRQGDVLIKGEEKASDGGVEAVPARGSVTGRVWEGAAVQMSCVEVSSDYTGEQETVWTLRTPWFDMWPLPASTYACYDIAVSQQAACGIFIPVKLYAETRLEVNQSFTKRELSQVEAEATQAAVRKLREKVADEESLIDIWGNCSMIDTENVLSLAVGEMLVEIGTRSGPDMAAPGQSSSRDNAE